MLLSRRGRPQAQMSAKVFRKKGKSKRGQWTKAQRDYVSRCVEAGCVACFLGMGIAGTPAAWHHCKDGFHGAAMRAPHEYGLALCHYHHDQGPESIHLNPEGFKRLIGMTESEAVKYCWDRFHWQDRT